MTIIIKQQTLWFKKYNTRLNFHFFIKYGHINKWASSLPWQQQQPKNKCLHGGWLGNWNPVIIGKNNDFDSLECPPLFYVDYSCVSDSVAEPPPLWAAQAVLGPGAEFGQNGSAPAPNTKFCHFQLFKKFIINASRPWIIFTSVMDPDPYSECGSTKGLNNDPIWIRIQNTG